MRNNTKKGFTLVELLVVIAILAILATVSVVGYSSFIERADISVDEQLVAQLNNFLEAYQADHTNRFYGEKITDKNAHYIIEDIMELGGLKEIRPQSAKYGYHIFLDLNKGEFVLDKEEETIAGFSPAQKVLSAVIPGFAAEEDKTHANSMAPEYVFTKGDYFFADTHGSDIADVIRGFYEHESEFTGEMLDKLHADAIKLKNTYGSAFADVAKLMEKSAFMTDEGIIVLNINAQHSALFIHKGTEKIVNIKKDSDGSSAVTPERPLVVVPEGTIIILPSTVNTILSGALEIKHEDGTSKVTVEIDTDNINNIEYFGAGFANSDVEIQFNDGKKYTCEGTKILDSNGNAATDELTYPELVSFDISTKEIFNKTNGKNVAFDVETFSLLVTDAKVRIGDEVVDGYAPVTFEIHPEYKQYVEIENTTVKFKKVPTDGKIIILANGQEFTINVSRVVDTDIYIGVNKIEDDKGAMTLVYAAGINEYRLHSNSLDFTYNSEDNILPEGIMLDNRIKVELPENSPFTYNEFSQVLTLDGTKATEGETTITVSLGGCVKEVTLNLVSESNSDIVFVRATDNIMKVGNKNAVKLNDLFKLVGNEFPAGCKLKVVTGKNNGYYGTNTTLATSAINDAPDGYFALDGKVDQSITFKAENVYTLCIVDSTGKRISEEHDIEVVGAYNARTAAEAKTHRAKNIVLLCDIAAPLSSSGKKTWDLKLEGTFLYGNNFVFDVRNGKSNADAIITLQAKNGAQASLESVMIIGEVYENFIYSMGSGSLVTKYDGSSSIVAALNNSTIKNCYIANGRSPVRVRGTEVTIENSVFFGGRYANIDLCKGILNLRGDIKTINEMYKNVVGCGIVVDLNDAILNMEDCDLYQYNFLASTDAKELPNVKIEITTPIKASKTVSLEEVFNSILRDKEKADWIYHVGDVQYVNASIAYLGATGTYAGGSIEFGQDGSDDVRTFPKGYEKTTYNMWIETIKGNASAHIYSPAAVKNYGENNEYFAKLLAEKDEMFNAYRSDNFLP